MNVYMLCFVGLKQPFVNMAEILTERVFTECIYSLRLNIYMNVLICSTIIYNLPITVTIV